MGSTGGDDGIVGTVPEGGGGWGEGLVGVFDGKTTPAALDADVDVGSSDRIVLGRFCLGCSPCSSCGEYPARTVPVAELTRIPGERPCSKSNKGGREAKRAKSVNKASRSGRIMTVNPVRHAVRRLRS